MYVLYWLRCGVVIIVNPVILLPPVLNHRKKEACSSRSYNGDVIKKI